MTTARFITFEGGEGSGKSTQARRLAERLRQSGCDVLVTREPGGSPFAEALRGVILGGDLPPHAALSEALLFYAARADHLKATIRPALAAGRWVICDRFSDSTRVYQGVAGRLSEATLEALEGLVVAPTKPDLTVMVDIPPEIGLARTRTRAAPGAEVDPYERRDLAFHRQLRAGFLAIARSEARRCVVVDGTETEDAVADAVWAAVTARLHAEAPG
jgi:dTMP kinase